MKRFQSRNVLFLATLACTLGLGTAGRCDLMDYLRLLNPRVLKQLDTDTVRLVNELPNLDHQNELIVGRLFAQGGLNKARLDKDGVWRAGVRVVKGEFLWNPAIIVMKQGGVLELEFSNPDKISHHAAFLPSNGGRVVLNLPPLENGRARIELDGPGLYWFGCPISNHAGRGMLGLVLVGGEVPDEAKLDRPKQKRP
jgi:PQQ system protein